MLTFLRVALVIVGAGFVSAYGFFQLLPTLFEWGESHYVPMIIGIYTTLGIFLLMASRSPGKHRSLIWFTVFSSLVHAGVMMVQALRDPMWRAHLYGDVPVLVLVALALAIPMMRLPALDLETSGR
ncbi:DUF6632 domain-containing protein [Actinocorallia lasiicapitis]